VRVARRSVAFVIAVALLGAACGDIPTGLDLGEDGPGAIAGPNEVECAGVVYDPATLDDAPPASTLPEAPLTALVEDGLDPPFDPSQDWRVVNESSARVDLIRELDEPLDAGEGDVRTHEVVSAEVINGAPNVPDGTWMLTLAGPCAQRTAGSDAIGEANLTLAEQPDPATTSLPLLVHERACASGQSADGRVRLLTLEETDSEIRLRIGVQPLPGDQNCPGNPPTPFTVDLQQPVANRSILDVSVVPPRELIPAPDTSRP
jgi:hypothetical protein